MTVDPDDLHRTTSDDTSVFLTKRNETETNIICTTFEADTPL